MNCGSRDGYLLCVNPSGVIDDPMFVIAWRPSLLREKPQKGSAGLLRYRGYRFRHRFLKRYSDFLRRKTVLTWLHA